MSTMTRGLGRWHLGRWLILLGASVLLLLLASPARAEPVVELVRRADMAYRGQTSAAVLAMEVKTKSFERSYEIVSWDDSRGKDRTLIKILGPASWRGNGTLKIGEQLKLYDPKTNHVTVVGASMLGDSWMGSHFSNDDLVKETRLARDYDARLLSQRTAAGPAGGQATFYQVELRPKPTAPVPWGKIVYELWEQGQTIAPSRADYYRKASDATAARTITFTDVKPLGGRLLPSVMTCTLARKPGEQTRIVYKKLKLDVNIPDDKFTEQSLRR